MSRSKYDLSESWDLLTNRPPNEKWNAVRLGLTTNGSEVLVALDNQKLRHLLVPAKDQRYSVRPQGELSIEIGQRSFVFFNEDTEFGRYLDITCKNERLNDQFDLVIESVLEAVADSEDGAKAALFEVSRWRQLFATLAASPRLSLQEKVGLFAELTILSQLKSRDDFLSEWWTGPKRAPHDFELDGMCVEVKGYKSDDSSVQVHGFAQLTNCENKTLLIVLVEVDENEEGETVGELLERTVAGEVFEHELRQLAAMAGIFDSQDDSERFLARKVWIGKVGQGFPRVTRAEVPTEAIRNINYELGIVEILPYLQAYSPQEASEALNG